MTDQTAARNARDAGTVVVFSGHMIDRPDRQEAGLPPRFPPDSVLERRIGEEIKRRLIEMQCTFGYCSVTRGSDILFAESALELRIGLHVVITFDLQDYIRTSVDYGFGSSEDWRARCDRMLSQASEVTQARPGPYRNDHYEFAFADILMCVHVESKARDGEMCLLGMVVIDRSSAALPGSTGDFMRMSNRLEIDNVMVELKRGNLVSETYSAGDSTGL